MKTLLKVAGLIVIVAFSFGNSARAQKKIPDSVKKSFAKKHADIKEVRWQMEEGNFEGQFKQDGGEYTAVFSVEGEWIETAQKLRPRDLPKEVSAAAKENYSSYSIVEAEKVVSATEGDFYELKLKKGSGLLELKVFSDGKMAVEELETEDDED